MRTMTKFNPQALIAGLAEGGALPPVHPGEVLAEEFLAPLGLGTTRAARALGVPRTRIERLVAGETAMTEDTALRLEAWTGASAEFWLALQSNYNLRLARARRDPSIAAIQPAAPGAPPA